MNWRYCQTMGGRGPQPLFRRHVSETSETWLQISMHSAVADQMDSCGCSWAVTRMLWSTDKVRAEPSQFRAYVKRFNKKTKLWQQNGCSPSPYRNLTWREIAMNFEEKKTTYKEVTENSDASSKNLKSEWKKINYDDIDTSSKNLKASRKSSTRSTSDSKTDGQTDRILIARPRLHSMQRSKN